MQPCEQKETILAIQRDIQTIGSKIGENSMMGNLSHEQIQELFSRLTAIQSHVDQHIGGASSRDEKIEQILQVLDRERDRREQINKAVESLEYEVTSSKGLTAQVATLSNVIASMQKCIEARKQRGEHKREMLEGKTGWSRFFALVALSFDDGVRKYAAPTIILCAVFLFFKAGFFSALIRILE